MRSVYKGNCPNTLMADSAVGLERLENNIQNGDKPQFDSNIYASAEVKDSLKTSHKNKCAYCERNLNGDYGDVEHYRPKGGVTGNKGGLGYWWLAYEWSNLLLSCSECNRSCKRNSFPLADENQRNILERNISEEQPLLINPTEEDPSDHLEFNRWVVLPKVIDGEEDCRGKKTIEIMRLNDRPDLVEKRKRRWNEIIEARNSGIDVSFWIDDSQEFTGMFQNQI